MPRSAWRNILALLRQALDVGLIDDRVFPALLCGRAVVRPTCAPRRQPPTWYMSRALSRRSKARSSLLGAGAIARNARRSRRTCPPSCLAVGVDQQLVRVEAVAVLRLIRTMHAVAVKLARRHVRQIDVPHVIGAFRQRDALGLALPCAVEQAQLDLRRQLAENSAKLVPRPSQVAPSG